MRRKFFTRPWTNLAVRTCPIGQDFNYLTLSLRARIGAESSRVMTLHRETQNEEDIHPRRHYSNSCEFQHHLSDDLPRGPLGNREDVVEELVEVLTPPTHTHQESFPHTPVRCPILLETAFESERFRLFHRLYRCDYQFFMSNVNLQLSRNGLHERCSVGYTIMSFC